MQGRRKVLVLGHNGMLGRMCVAYFKRFFQVETLDMRFTTDGVMSFIQACKDKQCDVLINAIGMIPQKYKDARFDQYNAINTLLPMFLAEHLKTTKCIFPSTDCVFSGNNRNCDARAIDSETDATDFYGISKALMENSVCNTNGWNVVIRCSVIGPYNSHGLFGWFQSLPENSSIDGYTNHIWNGVTTLEWCKFVHKLVDNEAPPSLIHYGTCTSYQKYEILVMLKEYLNRSDITIRKCEFMQSKFRDLKIVAEDCKAPPLQQQLHELKQFISLTTTTTTMP